MSQLEQIFRDLSIILTIRAEPSVDHDDVRILASSYDLKDGVPDLRGEQVHAEKILDGRLLLVATRAGGRGALVDDLMRAVEGTARKAIELRVLRRILQRVDFALFALDHDEGHGPEVVEQGVRDLWAMSGADQWSARAAQRERLLKWLEVADKVKP